MNYREIEKWKEEKKLKPFEYAIFKPNFKYADKAPKAVSFFSGIGGLDLGFVEAGFKVICASDIDEASVNVYNLNFPEQICRQIDIKDISKVTISEKPDVVLGGFPCQGFSSAGKRNIMDKRNSLAWEMIRMVAELKPKIVIGENVLGIKSMKHPEGGLVIDRIIKDLSDLGYTCRWKVLNAADFGVPQIRRRVFIIASISKRYLVFPDELVLKYRVKSPSVPLKTVLSWIKKPPTSSKDSSAMNHPLQHVYKPFSPSDREIVPFIPPGGNWRDIPKDKIPDRFIKIEQRWGKKSPGFYRRQSIEKISGTLSATMNPSNCTGSPPLENRRYTVREAAYIQSFPKEYQFSNNITKAYRQIGNAVPPYLAWQIARPLILMILNRSLNLKVQTPKAQTLTGFFNS